MYYDVFKVNCTEKKMRIKEKENEKKIVKNLEVI